MWSFLPLSISARSNLLDAPFSQGTSRTLQEHNLTDHQAAHTRNAPFAEYLSTHQGKIVDPQRTTSLEGLPIQGKSLRSPGTPFETLCITTHRSITARFLDRDRGYFRTGIPVRDFQAAAPPIQGSSPTRARKAHLQGERTAAPGYTLDPPYLWQSRG
ncbi:hypothetical protein ES705_20842 [subsurface metagenome]